MYRQIILTIIFTLLGGIFCIAQNNQPVYTDNGSKVGSFSDTMQKYYLEDVYTIDSFLIYKKKFIIRTPVVCRPIGNQKMQNYRFERLLDIELSNWRNSCILSFTNRDNSTVDFIALSKLNSDVYIYKEYSHSSGVKKILIGCDDYTGCPATYICEKAGRRILKTVINYNDFFKYDAKVQCFYCTNKHSYVQCKRSKNSNRKFKH